MPSKQAEAEVGKVYRLRYRDVFVDRRSSAASHGYRVHWKSVDSGPPCEDELGEVTFLGEAELLIGLDDTIILSGVATTLRKQIAAKQGTTFRVSGEPLSGPNATTYSATIWSGTNALAGFPVSAATYEAITNLK